MAHKNPSISKTIFFVKPKCWQTTLFIGSINICEIQDGEKITADEERTLKNNPLLIEATRQLVSPCFKRPLNLIFSFKFMLKTVFGVEEVGAKNSK
jgi:hypothetical protein